MKKEGMAEKTFCDVCVKEASGYQNCLVCGKDFCYDCMKTEAIKYRCGVYYSGNYDALYCMECDENARKNDNCLHAAYRRILSLRNEQSEFYIDFNKRAQNAEQDLKRCFKIRGR